MPHIAVGVDAGGTKTAVAYSLDRVCKGVWYGGAANATVRGPERAGATIAETIELALEGALPNAIFVGAAGAGRSPIADDLRSALESRFPNARVAVRDDAYIALRAAIPEGDGIVLVAGTGTIAYAERGGSGYRCGGYGYLFGDAGSGFAIGSAAVERLLRAYDGRVPRDDLTAEIETALGSRSVQDALQEIYGHPQPAGALAELAPVVLDLAGRGDRSASAIVQRAAADLTDLVKGAIKLAGFETVSVPLAFAGGLLASSSLLSYLLETRLLHDFPEMPIRKDNPDPYAGALGAAEQLL